MERLRLDRQLSIQPLNDYIAAVSVGIVENTPVLDLCYLEDAQAEVDMNVVLTGRDEFVEIQGTAESNPFSRDQLNQLQDLAVLGIRKLIEIQKEFLGLNLEP